MTDAVNRSLQPLTTVDPMAAEPATQVVDANDVDGVDGVADGASPTDPGRRATRGVGPALSLVAWIYLYLIGLLGLWVMLVSVATGWSPIVITSGSMSPVLRVGDVALIQDHPDELVGQRSIVTFERGPQVITHRIFEVEPDTGTYITKGDANPTPDTDPVPAESVIGVARLVVPLVGLPLVWFTTGQLAPLAAMGVLSLLAFGVGVAQSLRRRETIDRSQLERTSGVAEQAVRRVRVLIAVMIASQYVIDGSRFDIQGLDVSPGPLMAFSLVWLAATNLVSIRFPIDDHGWVMAVGQLVADTALVVFMTTVSGGSGIGWVLTAVPIVEAAVRFRLAGALVHWMLMAVIAILGRLWILQRVTTAPGDTIEELEQLLDQMSVLLLVIVPGAFLAEQLLGDVLIQRRATREAVNRGRLLENVAEVGHQVTRIGSALFETLIGSALRLGFDSVDVWARSGDGTWTRVHVSDPHRSPSLPEPGLPGSGLRPDDLGHREVLVDDLDPDVVERHGIRSAGLAYLVRITLADDETTVVLRGGESEGGSVDADKIEALRLLCGQASVAMQNQDLVGELRELHSQMEHQALHDGLTGLPNRVYFLRELAWTLDKPGSGGAIATSAVLFLDLNGFKPVNDRLGHDAGDELLKVVAQRLTEAVGASGLVARLGGDEFTVLLPDGGVDTAEEAAGAIHGALAKPITLPQDTVSVGTSIGVAVHEVGVDAGELLRRADTAMYAAKQAGGERPMAHYNAGLEAADDDRNRLTDELEAALAQRQLNLAYQPLVSVPKKRVVGAEVLLRWTHPRLGRISPNLILEAAERANLVGDLHRWIVQQSLDDLAGLGLADDDEFTLAVNASPAELESPQLIPNIAHALHRSGVPAHRLVVELSERIVAAGENLESVIGQLVELGIVLSLDDFGEGKTSLGHLRRLPVRQLKLDSLLVRQACTNPTDRIILQSVVDLGHNLGLEVVAEGIETREHLETVVATGAELIQGFGLFRPMPIEDLARLLASDGRRTVASRLAPATWRNDDSDQLDARAVSWPGH